MQPGTMAVMGWSFDAHPLVGKVLTLVGERGFQWWWLLDMVVLWGEMTVAFVVCVWCGTIGVFLGGGNGMTVVNSLIFSRMGEK